jgi:hypothetical protein
MNSMGFNQAKNIRIVGLMMQETGTYNTQYVRPYNTVMDGSTLNVLTERVMNSHDHKINSGMLSGLTSCFIQPQAQPESEVGISNGWTERRIRFLLEIEFNYHTGGTSTQYIQGYTSHSGVISTGAIDPKMEFYVNSVTQTRKVHRQTPLGVQVFENVVENSHVLASNNWTNMYAPTQQRLLRPQDVFTNISHSHLSGAFEQGVGNYYDGRSTLRGEAQKSRRSNGLSSVYAASIIDAYATASQLTDFGQNEDQLLQSARGNVVENPAATDPFLSAITNINSRVVGNKFTFGDLQILDQNVVNVTNYAVPGAVQRTTAHQTGMTASWGGSDRVTQAATILSQSIPAIMMDLMLRTVAFMSTNHDLTGQMRTVMVDAKGFSNMDITRNCDLFIHRLEKEVINDLTYGNQEAYTVEMRVNLAGETWIKISIGNSGVIDFVTPSFCDNLFVPVLTTNHDTVAQLAGDFESLTTTIKDAIGSNYIGGQSNIMTTV